MALLLPTTSDDNLMSALSPRDLVVFSWTSKNHQQRVEAYIRRAFNIENLLRKYFTPLEVKYFRYLQSCTQMFISGSTALQFLDRIEYPDSDLDIYVEHRHKEMIVEWLLQVGYEFKSRRTTSLEEELEITLPDSLLQPGYFGRGVANVYNFYKHHPERKIQLITCHHCPLEVVLNFHSTCVMNIITHEKAYAFYPKATFEERRSLMYSTEGIKQDSARKKYVSRGWSMVESLTASEIDNRKSAFKEGPRYVGDPLCWTIDIHPNLDLSESFIEANHWSLHFDPSFRPLMEFGFIETKKLLYSYLFGTDDGAYEYIRPALCSSGYIRKLDADILKLLRWRRAQP